MKILKLGWVVPIFFLSVTGLRAEPYFAAWKGVNCNACHVNETGGWLRDGFGKNYGTSLQTFDWQGLSDAGEKIQSHIPPWTTIGIDLHESYTVNLYPKSYLNQSSFNQNGSSSYYPSRQSFSMAVQANDVISGVFTYRLDEALAKEVYGLISNLPEGAYLKLGRFMVPYGLTLSDDNSLVRAPLNAAFSFDNPTDDGLEAGIYPIPFFLNAAVINGPFNLGTPTQPSYNEKTFSAKGGMSFSEWTLAGSIFGENLDLNDRSLRYGAFGWGRIGPMVVLAEADWGYDGEGSGLPGPVVSQTNYQAYHASAEFDLGNDVYLRLVNEWLNDSRHLDGYDGFRDMISLRCYPVRNLKTQIDFVRLDPVAAVNNPDYSVVADAFVFY